MTPTTMSRGVRVELDVERPVAGGLMLARHEGHIVFVTGAIPGERVVAQVERVARGTVYAETVDLVTPSVDRRPGVAGRCGGSSYSHIDYERQLALKALVIEDAWRRLARCEPPAPIVVVRSPERGYRSRARVHVDGPRLGFYQEGTHRLCDAASTGQLADATVAWLHDIQQGLETHGTHGLLAIEIVENAPGMQRACHLHVASRPAAEACRWIAEGLTGVSYQVEESAHGGVLEGEPSVVEDLPNLSLRHDARSFFQGNRFLLEPLVQAVADALDDGAHDGRLLDLYAGTGLLGLAMAARGRGPVALVEGDAWSGRDLVENARALDAATNSAADAATTVACESVERFLSRPRTGFRAWIVDPPRTGLSEAVRTALLRDRPRRLIYVSCDVPTLARDVRSLVGGGYHVRSLVGFDMFPGTGHVEAVCVLGLG